MKTYEEALNAVVNFIQAEGSSSRTALRWGAFVTLSISYDKECSDVYDDAQKINDRLVANVKLERLRERQERHKKLREERGDK